jgi:hypothetical protein
MSQESFVQIFGEIEAKLGFRGLRKVLAQAGLKTEVRESANYEGGRYLLVDEWEELILEQVGKRRYLLHADAGPASQICRTASVLSQVLTGAGMRHRLEVYYEGENQMMYYWDHRWPRMDG